jgi:hypothetical protein
LRGPLSPEGRERLRQAALAARPWLHARGPTTPTGKARSAQNGRGRQVGEVSARAVRRQLAALTGLVVDLAALRRLAQRPQRGGEVDRE